ncbi:T9SS type A sorting domain-containing protein [Microvirga sp. STS02]|uniref:T9SS type A sorting domain-containing protein n=1 Tax=Hymenobacter negativus TaxID=2795026 RepID=UPI0018DB0C3A|nr:MULTISPECIES: T9SS type A sorting domain-containing protein [Bacteria]MBH8567329.1 T9SS type A sorting domain-containing protein [Hymenobacter negativus]MBR7207061.1 T9SS type A sorting domain-containing protein [Microvirga sp. STS02]
MRSFFTLLSASLLTAVTGYAQAPPYNFYYGNLHAHSAYSDGNQDAATSGSSTPLQDYQFASASLHFDFLGLSEHNHAQAGMNLPNYALGRTQATQATTATFVALHGTEWGVISGGGHMLVYGVHKLYGWETGNYDEFVAKNDYQSLMRKINNVPGAFALFAHPQSGDYGNLAGSAAFSPRADSALVGVPLRSGPATSSSTLYNAVGTSYESTYRTMLAKGYHVGMSLDHDNHNTTFGRTTHGRLVVLAPSLSEANLLQALRARRFYGSDDWNAQVTLTLAGQPMGTIARGPAAAALAVSYADADNEAVASITLLRGVPGSGTLAVSVASAAAGATALSYTDPTPTGTAYYYAVIVQADGDRIVTSPIWYTRTAATATLAAQAALPVDVFPNPAVAGSPVTVSYYLEAAATVSADVRDELGRPVRVLANGQAQGAGPHTLDVPTAGLAAGLYTVRLVHDGAATYRKLVVE